MNETPPNIHSATDHQNCLTRANSPRQDKRFREGDIRRCQHGKVQICYQPVKSSMVGPGVFRWGDLRKFWDRKTYKRAVSALEAAES